MDNALIDDKSFGLQPLPNGEPSNEWTPNQLGWYAQAQQQQIVDGEKLMTPAYWRLGQALHFAKKNFGHGQWTKFLESWGIDKTRAARARAIYGAFDNEQAVLGISVEQAYKQRKRRRVNTRKIVPQPEGQALDRLATDVCKQSESLIDQAAFIDPKIAVGLLPKLEEAIQSLQRLRGWLESQARNGELAVVHVDDQSGHDGRNPKGVEQGSGHHHRLDISGGTDEANELTLVN